MIADAVNQLPVVASAALGARLQVLPGNAVLAGPNGSRICNKQLHSG